MLQMQLSNLRSEKRSINLVSNKTQQHYLQIGQIESEEMNILTRINNIQSGLSLAPQDPTTKGSQALASNWISSAGERKSQGVTLALAIFLGFFGAHRFYTGHTKLGILYFFTFGLFGFVQLIQHQRRRHHRRRFHLRIRSPSVTGCTPAARAASISASANPPSGPMKTAIVTGSAVLNGASAARSVVACSPSHGIRRRRRFGPAQGRIEAQRLVHLRQHAAPGLLGGFAHDALPALQLFGGVAFVLHQRAG
jgi:hypothetical protein